MKRVIFAVGVASTITGVLAWIEEHNRRPGAELLALQFKKEHALLGAVAGILTLIG
jgi:hypothetical protein